MGKLKVKDIEKHIEIAMNLFYEIDPTSQEQMKFIGMDSRVVSLFANRYEQDLENRRKYEEIEKERSKDIKKFDSDPENKKKFAEAEERKYARSFDYFKFLENSFEATGESHISKALKAFEEEIEKAYENAEPGKFTKTDIAHKKNEFWNRHYDEDMFFENKEMSNAFNALEEKDKEALADMFSLFETAKPWIRVMDTKPYLDELQSNLENMIEDEKDNNKKAALQEMSVILGGLAGRQLNVHGGILGQNRKLDDIEDEIKKLSIKADLFLKEQIGNSEAEDIKNTEYDSLMLVHDISEYAHYICLDNNDKPKYKIVDNEIKHPYVNCERSIEKIVRDFRIDTKENILKGNRTGVYSLMTEEKLLEEEIRRQKQAQERAENRATYKMNEIKSEYEASEKAKTDSVIACMEKIVEEIESSGKLSSRNSDISGEMYKLAKSCTEDMKKNGTYLATDLMKLSKVAKDYLNHKVDDGFNKNAYGKIWAADAILKLTDVIKDSNIKTVPDLASPEKATVEAIMDTRSKERQADKAKSGENVAKTKVKFNDLLMDEIKASGKEASKTKELTKSNEKAKESTKGKSGLGK